MAENKLYKIEYKFNLFTVNEKICKFNRLFFHRRYQFFYQSRQFGGTGEVN